MRKRVAILSALVLALTFALAGTAFADGGPHGGYGATVIVMHENGDSTLYGHNSSLAVTPGARVEAGALIAYSGSSGSSTGPHVHYEVRTGGDAGFALAGAEEAVEKREVPGQDLRRAQELLMDETMHSILGRIRGTLGEGATGGGG